MLKNPCKSTRFYPGTILPFVYFEKAGRPYGRAVRCRWQGFFITSASSNEEIYATGG
jgi:hypothetical protein